MGQAAEVMLVGSISAILWGFTMVLGPGPSTPNLTVGPGGVTVDSAGDPAFRDPLIADALDFTTPVSAAFPISTPGPSVTVLYAGAFHGRCPVCEAAGTVSEVHGRNCVATLMGTSAWYDTAGNYHFSDPNRTTCEHRCSLGHWFRVIYGGTEELVLRPDGTRLR